MAVSHHCSRVQAFGRQESRPGKACRKHSAEMSNLNFSCFSLILLGSQCPLPTFRGL